MKRTTRADSSGIRWLDTSTAGNTSITSKIGRQNKATNVIEKCICVQESLLKEGACRICGAGPQKEEKTTKISLFHFSLWLVKTAFPDWGEKRKVAESGLPVTELTLTLTCGQQRLALLFRDFLKSWSPWSLRKTKKKMQDGDDITNNDASCFQSKCQ